jgi:hypothetical protein
MEFTSTALLLLGATECGDVLLGGFNAPGKTIIPNTVVTYGNIW